MPSTPYYQYTVRPRGVPGQCASSCPPRPLVKLTDHKRGPFNPRLPSIRHYNRDSAMMKLADEHCRTTTVLAQGDFAYTQEGGVPFIAPQRLHCQHITHTGRALADNVTDPKAIEIENMRFQKVFCKESARIAREIQPHPCEPPSTTPDVTIDGYMIRYHREDPRNWNSHYQSLPRKDTDVGKSRCARDNINIRWRKPVEDIAPKPQEPWPPYKGKMKNLAHTRSNVGF